MKIECVKEKMVEAIAKAEKITGKNLTLPVLGCILIDASGSEVIIKSTNLDLGLEIKVPAKIEKTGKVAVPGSILNSFLANSEKDKNIIFEVVEGNLKITTSKNSTLIKTLNPEDFPVIPTPDTTEKSLTINIKDFIKGLKSVWYGAAVSSVKPELSSVYIHSEDGKLFFVATDSFRLAEKKIQTKLQKQISNLLIPVKNISDIIRIFDGNSGDIEIHIGKNQISFKQDTVYLTSRVIDGIFPDYNQIIPKKFTTSVTMLKQDLVNALKMATIFSDKFNKLSVSVKPSKKQFQLATKNADVGENINTLEAICEGEDLDINFNHKYIVDSLQSLESDSISLEFNGLTKPLVITGVNDPSFLYLVMPINK